MSCRWVSAKIMAQALGVTPRTIRMWAKMGKLVYIQPGGEKGNMLICPKIPEGVDVIKGFVPKPEY